MMDRDELVAALDALYDVGRFRDYGPNGLQVEGAAEVRRVVTGVTACQELIDAAIAADAQMIVVHHGIFWDGQPVLMRGMMRSRVKALLDHDVSLLGYHLPMDHHPDIGNNAPALRELGLTDLQPFGEARGNDVGWWGRFDEPVPAEVFRERAAAWYETEPLAFMSGPEVVRTVGLVSGGAQSLVNEALGLRLDAFMTGEVSEFNFHVAREEGIHFLALGHHASERVGPRCLARHLQTSFDLDARFIDVPNPV